MSISITIITPEVRTQDFREDNLVECIASEHNMKII